MPKRVLDFDALWGSDKVAACAPWAQAEYAWLYGLADASGCFEITNLRVIWGRVAAIRAELTIERLEKIFAEFQDKGLLFVWEHEGKRYAHWTGSDVPGRLPPPSWRMRLERFAPPVPKPRLAQYMARFARGRAALGGAGFGREAATYAAEQRFGAPAVDERSAAQQGNLKFEISDLRSKPGTAEADSGMPVADSESWIGPAGGVAHPGSRFGARAAASETALVVGGRPVASRGCDGDRPPQSNLKFEISDLRFEGEERGAACSADSGDLKPRLEAAQGQDLDLGLNWDGKREWDGERERADRAVRCGSGRATENLRNELVQPRSLELQTRSLEKSSETPGNTNSTSNAPVSGGRDRVSRGETDVDSRDLRDCPGSLRAGAAPAPRVYVYPRAMSAKELAVERELRVGQGPVCRAGVKPEVLERIRARELARKTGNGSG